MSSLFLIISPTRCHRRSKKRRENSLKPSADFHFCGTSVTMTIKTKGSLTTNGRIWQANTDTKVCLLFCTNKFTILDGKDAFDNVKDAYTKSEKRIKWEEGIYFCDSVVVCGQSEREWTVTASIVLNTFLIFSRSNSIPSPAVWFRVLLLLVRVIFLYSILSFKPFVFFTILTLTSRDNSDPSNW